jgi:hypothetical protein
MGRTLCWAAIVLAVLVENAGAQRPTIGFSPSLDDNGSGPAHLATLGDPLINQAPAFPPPAGTSNQREILPFPQPLDPTAAAMTPVSSADPIVEAPALVPPPGGLPTMEPPQGSFTGTYKTLPRPVAEQITVTQPGDTAALPGDKCNPPEKMTRLFDNFSLFFGLNGSKEPLDLGINANLGYRLAFNWGFALMENVGLGFQVGSALNYSQNALALLEQVDGVTNHWQNFTTLGVFQRSPSGISWGVAYDFRYDDYFDRTFAGQWRAQIGLPAKNDNEIGVWATFRDHGDTAVLGPFSYSVQPISQWNVYWRHIWTGEIVTRLWVGIASEHTRYNLLLPPNDSINHPFVFGGDIFVPLTDNLAIFGEAQFITPNDTGTVTALLGIAWYPGTARGTARSRFAPLLPVANNTTFALDLR